MPAVLRVLGLSCLLAVPAFSAGLYRDGVGARSMSLGGSATATASDPLDALFANPAALSEIRGPTLSVGADAGFAHGSFRGRENRRTTMNAAGFFGSLAVAAPVGPLRFALGVNPDIALRDRWRYRDTPGGADGQTSYGVRTYESEIVLLRTSAGVSWEIVPQLSVGASVGLLYNRNQLHAPYIFQSQPVLRTVKTLLDLETDGTGWNGQFGLFWKPLETLRLGVTYTTRARITTDGRATGNAGVQLTNLGLGAARPDFAYDAEVANLFPQQVSAGLAWKAAPKLLLTAQFDWINWADAFETLPVRLTHGSNRDMNALVGADKLNDDVPLGWRDQYVGRFGAEYAIDARWTVCAGYAYARNPVPAATLTPLTAAINKHTLTAGVGFREGRFGLDLAYQWEIPASETVRTSALAAGEYSGSTTRIGVQWIGLTATVGF